MTQPQPGTMQYQRLISEIDSGMIKIPQFQRNFVWDKTRSAKLIDSILRGFPIGTFILWKTKERLRVIRDLGRIHLPDTPDGDFVNYILDGQQRLTSLYASIKGVIIEREDGKKDDFAEMYVNLCADLNSDDSLVVTYVETSEESFHIKLQDLIHGGLSLAARFDEKYHSIIEQHKASLGNYLFPIITISDASIDVATEIFTRINIGGEPLTVFEIMCAKTYDSERNFDLAERYEGLIKSWETRGYETISSSTVLQAVSVCIVKECAKKHILALNKLEFISNWERVIDAFELAIDYFRQMYRIPVSALLPYDGLLVPFAYFFYHHPDKPVGMQKNCLQDYFWRTTLTSRFSNALETKIAQDIKKIDDILANKSPVYEEGIDISLSSLENNGGFSVGRAYIKGFLCLLASQTPLSFIDGAEVNVDNSWLKQANSKNYHHFFPRSYLRKVGVDEAKANHIANITIVDDFLNKRVIRDKSPSKYMRDFENKNDNLSEHMKSHFINDLDQFGVWDDSYGVFFEERLKAYQEELKRRILPIEIDKY